MFYETMDSKVRCNLCNHRCLIRDSQRGICKVRENRHGRLYSLVYGKVISQAVDPIEKKPLFHFLPGSKTYSIATVGCNFRCMNCQNYEISQMPRERNTIIGRDVTPKEIVNAAKRSQCESIAYTYTEPTIFFELAYETSILARKEGLRNLFVTNGYITEEALSVIHPYLDAANIDLKSFSDDFYRKICGARLAPVLDSIRLYKDLDIWIEITTLIIPTLNDSEENLQGIARFIKNIDPGIPWHVSRFYPTYELTNIPPTPVATLHRARKIGLNEGLKYVYEGNVRGGEGENTYCPTCGQMLIQRFGYQIMNNQIVNASCLHCGAKIDIIL